MPSIRVDHDGTVRCGECQSVHEFLPEKSCGYFGHPEDYACDYDPVGELRWRWFWPLLTDEAQQTLLGGIAGRCSRAGRRPLIGGWSPRPMRRTISSMTDLEQVKRDLLLQDAWSRHSGL